MVVPSSVCAMRIQLFLIVVKTKPTSAMMTYRLPQMLPFASHSVGCEYCLYVFKSPLLVHESQLVLVYINKELPAFQRSYCYAQDCVIKGRAVLNLRLTQTYDAKEISRACGKSFYPVRVIRVLVNHSGVCIPHTCFDKPTCKCKF